MDGVGSAPTSIFGAVLSVRLPRDGTVSIVSVVVFTIGLGWFVLSRPVAEAGLDALRVSADQNTSIDQGASIGHGAIVSPIPLGLAAMAESSEWLFTPGRRRASVRVVHETTDGTRILATDVEVADGIVSQGIGLMFRRSIPDDFALVFPFSDVSKRGLHMAFVPFDIDAIWLVDEEVRATNRLSAWTGCGRAEADTVIELPAGSATAVSVGDTVRIEGLRSS